MNLYRQLTEALHGPEKAFEMERILRNAAASGLKPGEALRVLRIMYDEAVKEDNDVDQEVICDFGNIAKNNCQPKYRIWTLEDTDANNARLEGDWE